MKKAYILLVHRNPDQVLRLIKRLEGINTFFFIHADKKSEKIFNNFNSVSARIHWVNNVVSNWGEFGIVRATLNSLEAIKATAMDFNRIILLSGQDYPIKSNEEIDRFLTLCPYSICLEYFSLPANAKWQPSGGMYRVNKYFFGMTWYGRYAAKALNGLGIVLPFFKRKIIYGMHPYSGSTWWIIDMYALSYILHFIHTHKGYIHYHRHTFASDEVFFHMILLNATDGRIRENILNDNLRYIRWNNIKSSHPEVLSEEDLGALIASPALFARKFDTAADPDILALIDSHCMTTQASFISDLV